MTDRIPEPLFTEQERDERADQLSSDEREYVIAGITADFPGAFDAVWMALQQKPSGLEEVTR